jgi:hypothetical protein
LSKEPSLRSGVRGHGVHSSDKAVEREHTANSD